MTHNNSHLPSFYSISQWHKEKERETDRQTVSQTHRHTDRDVHCNENTLWCISTGLFCFKLQPNCSVCFRASIQVKILLHDRTEILVNPETSLCSSPAQTLTLHHSALWLSRLEEFPSKMNIYCTICGYLCVWGFALINTAWLAN